jgi:precorrin-6A/cobalt-precorrin-6A reductase
MDSHGDDVSLLAVMTSSPSRQQRVLILGGTADANRLATALAGAPDIRAVLSYAGRTRNPLPPAIAWRVGGFGGIAGFVDYLRAEKFDRVIDATHPFAAQMSANAITACETAGVPLLALERAPWQRSPGDRWIEVDDVTAAAQALGPEARHVFLGIGRQHLQAFAAHQQHRYLIRLVDPPCDPLPLPNVEVIVARGPFDYAGDRAMLEAFRADIVVARNAGGNAAVAKIEAARDLALPVVMIRRPFIPPRKTVEMVAEVLRWLGQDQSPADRGV